MRDEFELSRRKMLAGLGTVGAASATAGMGTSAFFSDTEEFDGNSLTAGELDLKVVWQEHYSNWSEDEMQAAPGARMVDSLGDVDLDTEVPLPVPTDPMLAVPQTQFWDYWDVTSIDAYPDPDGDGIWDYKTRQKVSQENPWKSPSELDQIYRDQFTDVPDLFEDTGRRPLIDLGDVKPGDFGEVTFGVHLFDNPGYIWLNGVLEEASENGTTEPEAGDGDEVDGIVELLDEIRVLIWHDDGNNVLNTQDDGSWVELVDYNKPSDGPYSGQNIELWNEDAIIASGTLRSVLELLSTGRGIQLDADPRTAERNCFPNSVTRFVGFAWWLPVDHANEIQSDSATFDLGFYTEQCRHNDGSHHVVSGDGNGDFSSIQAAIDASDDGDEILVLDGIYEETIDIQDRSDLTIRSDSGATIRPTTTLAWGSETNFSGRTTGIRVVNSTDISFRGLTFDFEGIDDTAVNGLLFWESDGKVWDSTLEGMSNAGDAVDLTSYLGTNDPGSSTYSDTDRARVEFRNNEFVETGRIGINVEDFVEAIVVDNTFETTDAGYAVEFGSEGTGLVQDNEIHGYNTNFSDGSESAGIYVENAFPASGVSLVKDVAVIGNEVYDCTVGIRFGNEFDTITGDVDIEATLVGNYVHDNSTGVSVTDSGAEDGSSVSVVGSNNVLENNNEGYHLFEDNGSSEVDDGNITFDVETEEITDNDVGVLVESTSTSPVESFQSVAVTGSTIENNANYGVRNDVSDLLVDAEDNWWGASDGPSGQGPGSGDVVSANVDFDPFASSP